jgi:NTP pyrophosphatase (non-canonical NTP hydrolase)
MSGTTSGGTGGGPGGTLGGSAGGGASGGAEALTIGGFQALIERIYGDKDGARGTAGTFMWFSEEVGELSRALRRGQRANLEEEFADVLAWLATLASMHGVDLQAVAARKYGDGCPRCHRTPCACHEPASGHGAGPGVPHGGASAPAH